MLEKTQTIYGSSVTEAWSDAEYYEKETHINHPSQLAIEEAKQWVDSNEK